MRLRNLFAAAVLSMSAAPPVSACTLFKITQAGRTLVGNHEDAWSTNARMRFVNGEQGEFGVLYFSHFNGSPLRQMRDQGGMNTAGLMFDGFSVPVTDLRPQPGKPGADVHALVSKAMRTCSTVDQVADLFLPFNLSRLNGGMWFFCDRNGNYLVVEADTLVTGSDAEYAIGNFRASQCTDPGAVPIERFQRGRRMLAAGPDTSLAYCTTLLDSMSVCRSKLGEGTLYSYLLDLNTGSVHLFFYHDFTHRVTFNLKDELAKGDHEQEVASLFPTNPEFERLLAYKTPMHQRWLFWLLLAIGAIALVSGIASLYRSLRWCWMKLRGRDPGYPLWSPLVAGAASAVVIFLVPTLLMIEGVFYFGLGDALDPLHPLLRYLPIMLGALCIPILISTFQHKVDTSLIARWGRVQAGSLVAFVALLFYWDLMLM